MHLPKAFFAENCNKNYHSRMTEEGIGMMFSRWFCPFHMWAFDNGAYSAWTHGEAFPEEQFLRRVEKAWNMFGAETVSGPYFAITPDIVMGGEESLQFSLKWRKKLLGIVWPWYLAVQDGMKTKDVKSVLHLFDGIFIGGSDEFKATIPEWVDLGLPVHYGKCGTRKKIRQAIRWGVDSLDSSSPIRHGKEEFEAIVNSVKGEDSQYEMFLEE
tara:strand:- start:26 stop:664 length:639 start_codon:yes stop_codon:yes gene_type:complete